MQITPRIYVACLAAYNNGHLHGKWIDASSGIEIIREEIKVILNDSPISHAEEWAIHDSEFLGNISEYQDLEDIALRAEFIIEHGEIALALLDHHYDTQSAIDAIENYHGEHNSELDFTYDFVDSCGYLEDVPESVARYFDYESFSRDLFIGDYYSIKNGSKFYIFSNN